MSLISDFRKYRDSFGLSCLNTFAGNGVTTQNGALFTLEYMIVMLDDPATPEEDKFVEMSRLARVYESLEFWKGLTERFPGSSEGDSIDNTGAIACASGLLDHTRRFAKEMAAQGRDVVCTGIDETQDPERNKQYYQIARLVTATQVLFRPATWWSWIRSGFKPKFFWNNSHEPEKFAFWGWHGRSPGHLGLLDLCAYKYTTPFRWLSVLVGQFVGCFADLNNLDARTLPYTTWYFLTNATGWWERWFWILAYRLWVRILLKQYPNGMRDVYARYYNDPEHPIRKYGPRYFGE